MTIYYANLRQIRGPCGDSAVVVDFQATCGTFGYLVLHTPEMRGVEQRVRAAIATLLPDEADAQQPGFPFTTAPSER